MIKKIFTILLVSSSFVASAQFGIEANYGLNGSYQPQYNGLTHLGAGVTYDFDDTFGAKLDFGMDKFSIENLDRKMKTGISSTRISIQSVININNLTNGRSYHDAFNVLVHGGAGVSIVNSDIPEFVNTDHVVNLIFGITPRFEISENLFLTADISTVFNVSQHYSMNGELAYQQAPNSFTGLIYNASLGLAYRFGRNY